MTEIGKIMGSRILFFDGAIGTLLQESGLAPGGAPELWNLEQPEHIRRIHTCYLQAGCDVITTNTFGANRIKLQETGYSTGEVVRAAVRLAREAVGSIGSGFVALDIGPTGKLLQPMGDLAFEDAVSAFAEQAQAGQDAGADLILIETMSDLYEVKAAVLAAKETGLPVFVTLTLNAQGKLLTGGDIPAAVALLEGLGVDALGLNCGMGSRQMRNLLPELLQWTSLPVLLNPNAGLPECVDGHTCYGENPEEFAETMAEFAEKGAWLLGGCCGTTPEHLSALVKRCCGILPRPLDQKHWTWVSSYAKTVIFGNREKPRKPVMIGERINPTGKPRLKQALREKDLDYLLREGLNQQQNGADILDVNLGLPEIDETAMMRLVIPELQSVTDLPLQIDTSDPVAMETAMRLYNGHPLVNSVNGKEESMEAVFPLLKKYGGTAIALTLDESGIPATAAERFAIAQRIVKRAQGYGIPKENLIFDTLAMTVSADQTSAQTTLDTLQMVRDGLGCCTSLGVSNISFGLPGRETVNAAFFLMALQNGLSAAIVNPNSKAMMGAYYAYCTLSGMDANCQDYITFSEKVTVSESAGSTGNTVSVGSAVFVGGTVLAAGTELPVTGELGKAVVSGLKESACAAARALSQEAPLAIIDRELIPALDIVGREFEAGRLYLPQLLMSAEAAKAVFEMLRVRMATEGGIPVVKGKIILATVRGDVHDIGKNIVKVLLENYGYRVFDLGKDVPSEMVVDTAVREGVRLVGLSALMTTTVSRMEETIRLLREKVPDCKIMVGGAVLTEEYARQIGADFYGKDAMSSVRYAETVL